MSTSNPRTSDLQRHRRHFPALDNKSYFNYGGQGVMPKEAISAILGSYEFVQTNGPFSGAIFRWLFDEIDQTKDLFASMLNTERRCIAITQNVTDGCNIAMWGIDWQPGDHLVISDCEHTSINAIAEQIARRHKIELTYLPLLGAAKDQIVTIVERHLTPRTRMVVLSHVLWNTGLVMPVADIAELCRSKRILFCVDAAQSAGVLPVDVAALNVDFYAVTGHKWLCGPEGISALYIRKEQLDKLEPTFVGWRGGEMAGPDGPDATRFEVATSSFPLLAGFRAAQEIHNRFGTLDERYDRVKENVLYLRGKLETLPRVHLVLQPDQLSGLVSFRVDGMSHNSLVKQLEKQNIMVRTIPKPDCVRASVHYLTDRQEMDRLVDALQSAVCSASGSG